MERTERFIQLVMTSQVRIPRRCMRAGCLSRPLESRYLSRTAHAGMGVWSMTDTLYRQQILRALSCIYITAFERFHQMEESTRMLSGLTDGPATLHLNVHGA